ncbi:hypothetical protein BGW80DRAFT_1278722 [Lactifluus volemus]|nr:hypothetical protein BGW80DRAFT_1278722 [Lactifluus volemus]
MRCSCVLMQARKCICGCPYLAQITKKISGSIFPPATLTVAGSRTGIISDLKGRPLDFGLGRTLGKNFVVVAARKEVHA